MAITQIIQTLYEINSAGAVELTTAACDSDPTLRSLLPFDFVELVPTNFSNLLKLCEEPIVDRSYITLLWTNHCIVNLVTANQRRCIRCAAENSFYLRLALDKL